MSDDVKCRVYVPGLGQENYLRLCTRSWSRKLLGCPLQRQDVAPIQCGHQGVESRKSGICSWIILFEVQVLSMLRTILSAMVVGIGGD